MPPQKSAKPEKDKSLEKGNPKNFIPEAGMFAQSIKFVESKKGISANLCEVPANTFFKAQSRQMARLMAEIKKYHKKGKFVVIT